MDSWTSCRSLRTHHDPWQGRSEPPRSRVHSASVLGSYKQIPSGDSVYESPNPHINKETIYFLTLQGQRSNNKPLAFINESMSKKFWADAMRHMKSPRGTPYTFSSLRRYEDSEEIKQKSRQASPCSFGGTPQSSRPVLR
jgi:hypothetical protein